MPQEPKLLLNKPPTTGTNPYEGQAVNDPIKDFLLGAIGWSDPDPTATVATNIGAAANMTPFGKLGKLGSSLLKRMFKTPNVIEIATPIMKGKAIRIGDAQSIPEPSASMAIGKPIESRIQEGRTTKIPANYDERKQAKEQAKKLRAIGNLKKQPVSAPSWNELIEMSKLNKPDVGYVSGYSSNMYPDTKSLPLKDVDSEISESNFMKEVNTLDKQGMYETNDMIKLLDANIPDTGINFSSDWKLDHAKNQDIPLDTPLITYDPSVPISEAERASKLLNTLINRQLSAQPTSFVKSMHIRPEPGGLFQNKKIVAGIDSRDPTKLGDTVGHEFQHAVDKQYNKEIFKNYPITMFAGLTGPPKGYFNHPSEVRARAAGKIAKLLEEEAITGQQMIDPKFLFEFGTGIESIGGEADDAFIQLMKRQNKPEYKYQSEPVALKLPFGKK